MYVYRPVVDVIYNLTEYEKKRLFSEKLLNLLVNLKILYFVISQHIIRH